jgi:hypothetical protein
MEAFLHKKLCLTAESAYLDTTVEKKGNLERIDEDISMPSLEEITSRPTHAIVTFILHCMNFTHILNGLPFQKLLMGL